MGHSMLEGISMTLHPVARAAALLMLSLPALAQTPPPIAPQRVVVTGSSIKQLARESALPLQVITEAELRQSGAVSAEDVVIALGVNAANTSNAVSSNTVFGPDQDRLTGGGSFANLRGLGPTATLVLLNGRRVTPHGMSGAAVDLSAIPMAAVARIEVLKDGASAIYGTDAIGGVINFILKDSYQGVSLGATLSQPLASGGGGTRRASVTAGTGDLSKDRYNLMASFTVDSNEILRGIDRPWATGFDPGRNLAPETTSAPHANIIGAANTALTTAGTVVGATDTTRYTNLNLLAIQGQCDALPFGVPLAPNATLYDRFGYTVANSRYRCATDYGRQFMLLAPKEAINGVVRANFKLGESQSAFVELVGSKTKVKGEFTPFQFSSTANAIANLQPSSPHYIDMRALVGAAQFDPTRPIAYRLRMWDWGYRTNLYTSENLRVATGIEGDVGAYSYRAGLSYGSAKGSADLIQGYARAQGLLDLLATGNYNPFLNPGEQQSDAVKAAIEATQARGQVFNGQTTLLQADGSLSGPLLKMPAGSLDFALGLDARKESYEFSGTQNFTCVSTFSAANLALTNAVMGCPGNASSPKLTRDVGAVFGELLIPVAKSLTVQLAVRHDEYQGFGGTTNPKFAFKFQPLNNLLVRGSASTGFRAPTPQQVKLGSVELSLTGTFNDPERCAVDPTQCNRSGLPYRQGGNPDLKPETSEQAMLGVAFQPMRNLQITADWWQIKLDDRIRQLSVATMIANYALFRDSFIRGANGNVDYVQAGWVNAASSNTKGLDISVQHVADAFGGRVSSSLNVTKMLSHKERLLANAPEVEFVGEWSNTTLYLPWKLSGNLGFKSGDWDTTLNIRYASSYLDEDRSPYTANPGPRRKVSPYTTFSLFSTYSGLKKGLSITAGVINLFDPPFTHHNVDNVIGAGWDPRVADPRGRTVQVSVKYDFQ
jgi:iron complex outermembrane recepter protein